MSISALHDLPKVKSALLQAVAIIERLEPGKRQPIDLCIRLLLTDLEGGLTTKAICTLVHRRRSDVIATVRLMAAAGQIHRDETGRWVISEEHTHGI